MRAISATILLTTILSAGQANAGLHYSGEELADLPSQWRGYLLDHKELRSIGIKTASRDRAHPLRLKYEDAAARLEDRRSKAPLSAEDTADLGAVHLRLGNLSRALEVLREGQLKYPQHFRVIANLGTAWQAHGDHNQAVLALQQAVKLAPGKLERAERLHLRLVQLRQARPRDSQAWEDLLGVHFLGATGHYEPGRLSAVERKKLPSDAVAMMQQLGLWLPADGKILWQLAELANAHGDIGSAAAMMEGCVTEFRLGDPELRRHRQVLRSALETQSASPATAQGAQAVGHSQHAGVLKPRSRRPLLNKLSALNLPPISATSINQVPWALFAETSLGKGFKPEFPRYLTELDGKQIALTGFIQPLGEDLELSSFLLIEYPVGCWYCEKPDLTGIIYVEVPVGRSASFTRGLVKVSGHLKLNRNDPENFLYLLRKARVAEVD